MVNGKHFLLYWQGPRHCGYGKRLENGTCYVVFKNGYCPLEKVGKPLIYPNLEAVLDIDVVQDFKWMDKPFYQPLDESCTHERDAVPS